MPALVAGIHALAIYQQARRGWQANSGLIEFASIIVHKSGRPDL